MFQMFLLKVFNMLKKVFFSVPCCLETSLVARGDRVPGLSPWSSVFVLLLQRLQVTRQDQVSVGGTDSQPVSPSRPRPRTLDLPELVVGRHSLADGSQLRFVLSLVSPLRLDRPPQLPLQG